MSTLPYPLIFDSVEHAQMGANNSLRNFAGDRAFCIQRCSNCSRVARNKCRARRTVGPQCKWICYCFALCTSPVTYGRNWYRRGPFGQFMLVDEALFQVEFA